MEGDLLENTPGHRSELSTISFKYEPFGRRIYKSSSSGTSIYAYDGDNLVEEANSSGAAVARYVRTRDVDEPLAMLRSAATSYYDADGVGSITSLSNAAGALAQTYTSKGEIRCSDAATLAGHRVSCRVLGRGGGADLSVLSASEVCASP